VGTRCVGVAPQQELTQRYENCNRTISIALSVWGRV
jgi:hypothetical protein